MKTQIAPLSTKLAAVLGAEGRQIRYISVPATARQERVCAGHGRDVAGDLAKIDAALDRLELGTFGWCIGCGQAICLKRLDHDPSVPRCQGCEDSDGVEP